MRGSLRSRLFLSFFVAILIALAIPYGWVQIVLRERVSEEARTYALTEAYHLRTILLTATWNAYTLADFVYALGNTPQRVTLLDNQGDVVADSAFAFPDLPSVKLSNELPEIASAIKQGYGTHVRRNEVSEHDVVYAAVRIPPILLPAPLHEGGMLRIALPPSTIQAHIDDLARGWPFVFGSILLLSPALAMLLAWKIEAPVRRMISTIERIATKDTVHHLPYPAPRGEFAQLAEAVNDMVERIDASFATIEAQKAQLETILHVMEEGVLVLGAQGRIRMVNDTLVRLFPLAENAEGRAPIEVIPSTELQEAIDSLLARPNTRASSIKLQIEPSRDLILSVQLARPQKPLHAVAAVAVFHNVTELVHLMRIRRDFVANVSHELRTPLTSIQGYAETMAELTPADEAMRMRCLDIIRRQAEQMSHLVEDLLTLTRLESSRLPLDLREVTLADLVKRVTSAMEIQAKARDLHITSNIAEDLEVIADEHFLFQVFRNLLENAFRYGAKGTAVEINAFRNGQEIVASVRDHGCGIPEHALKRIFERFYQVETSRTGPRSSGLGLAICKHIVDRHGGRIWAENTPGATIRFSLPLPDAPRQTEKRRVPRLGMTPPAATDVDSM